MKSDDSIQVERLPIGRIFRLLMLNFSNKNHTLSAHRCPSTLEGVGHPAQLSLTLQNSVHPIPFHPPLLAKKSPVPHPDALHNLVSHAFPRFD